MRIFHERTREFSGDQFLMTNDGERTQRAVKGHHGKSIPDWTFVIGIWSFPRLFANEFANNPG